VVRAELQQQHLKRERFPGDLLREESASGSGTSVDTGTFHIAGVAAVAARAVVGRDEDVMPLAAASTQIIDLQGRRAVPGLIDNHLHIIRGGLNFNMELRWDGVRSLADAIAMLKRQVAITPPPQWVRGESAGRQHFR
jgi:imidazolonepropionase-like amidohydrolase